MGFAKEKDFEDSIIKVLTEKYGWNNGVLEYKNEQELIDNWADFLFVRNNTVDRLNGVPLSSTEMQQLLDQLKVLRTPFNINQWLNGQTVSVKRDGDSQDISHRGKEISLEIYNKMEIASGSCRYQIARQPRFAAKSKIIPDRRGDFILLINGMPLIHVELKRSGVPVSEAYNQIAKYAHEGVFTGLFSMVQIFVAMNPEETVYFVNPGSDGKFDRQYFFHWTDNKNKKENNWEDIARDLLSIPMAHQLIGWYMVADKTDGVLKVMRPYQYYAAVAIADCVCKRDWSTEDKLGGYIWHTTGSGKTMTSFKCAQLVASSKDADKVVFLLDRIELSTQSLGNYRGFAGFNDDVSDTGSTSILKGLLKDDHSTLIVTSIQKMSRIKEEKYTEADLDKIRSKRLVFIIDECHRSTFGDMLRTIKNTFPRAMFFGFTGTPVFDENNKKENTTADLFGSELHRYSLTDGLNDKNVLGFDPHMVLTFKDEDVKERIALMKVGASKYEDIVGDPKKKRVYEKYRYNTPLGSYFDAKQGKWIKGLEAHIPFREYMEKEHTHCVVNYIKENWNALSRRGMFHAILATSSIPEAINYYRLFKEMAPELKVTALFDPNLNVDNPDNQDAVELMEYKEDGLVEIIDDYDNRYGLKFDMTSFARMKEDIGQRLAHKAPYNHCEKSQQIDLLIVVNQMLTGFDSKWVNTLYLDKEMQNQHLIQAFSRTNRLFGLEKPFGSIRYFRRPHTMKNVIERAFALYAGDRPEDLFKPKLPKNIRMLNGTFDAIAAVFKAEEINNFEKVPGDPSAQKEFCRLFKILYATLEAVKLQGFTWQQLTYPAEQDGEVVTLKFDEKTYDIIARRYMELYQSGPAEPGGEGTYLGIEGYISDIDIGMIDADYMNSRFQALREVLDDSDKMKREEALVALHKSFAGLSQEDQKYAEVIIHDLQTGKLTTDESKTFMDYINDYRDAAKNKRIEKVVKYLGLDEVKLRDMLNAHVTKENLDEFKRFSKLIETVDKVKAKAYLETVLKKQLSAFQVNMELYDYMRNFILNESIGASYDSEDEDDDVQMVADPEKKYNVKDDE